MSEVSVTSASQILESFWNIWSQVSQRKKPFSDFPVRGPGMYTLSWGIHEVAVAVCWPGKVKSMMAGIEWNNSSSETQGHLVGSIKCLWWKFTVKSRLGTYSYRTSSRSAWIACFWLARKKISEEKLSGDSRVFLHDVVFLIDCHSCVACRTGKVCRGKFQNKMLTTRKNYNL